MRVLGVDPGLTRCGLGIVEGDTGRKASCVAVDVIRTPADMDLTQRLMTVADTLDAWLTDYAPDVVAIERVFSQHNVRTVMGTAQVSGVIAATVGRHHGTVAFHTPSEVKAAITGSGRANKDQVGAMVARVLSLSTPPRPADAADALALAVCHLWRAPLMGRLAEAQARAAQLAKTHRSRVRAAASTDRTNARGRPR